MATTWAGWRSAFVLMAMSSAVYGEEPPRRPIGDAAARPEAAPAAPSLKTPEAAAAKADRSEIPKGARSRSDEATALRVETVERLKRMDAAAAKDPSAGGKKIRPVLEERLRLLDDWQKTSKDLRELDQPDEDTEGRAADTKAEIKRLGPLLEQSARDPESLLPPSFRVPAKGVTEAALSAMKEAIEAARGELREAGSRMGKLRSEAASAPPNPLALINAERDKLQKRAAALKAKQGDYEAAAAEAQTPEARDLAGERLVNFEWEKRLLDARLRVQEARLALQPKRAELTRLYRQAAEAQIQVSKRILQQMQARYRVLSETQERDLKTLAAAEQDRAARADDPLERYRARRTAEMHELHAKVLRDEKILTTSPSPSKGEQQALADRAIENLAKVKKMIEDGQISRLDALRLNNDFRRIGPEKERIIRNELTTVTNWLNYYEGALSNAETDLINVARDDRFERDSLRETLQSTPPAAVMAEFEEIEAKHRALLERRRMVLETLADRTEQTQDQILRRLRTLDEQYSFIRTNIFWVRDQEPIGTAIVGQAEREVELVARSLVRLACEACDRKLRGRVSVEFAAACVALVGLPWPLFRIRKAARRIAAD